MKTMGTVGLVPTFAGVRTVFGSNEAKAGPNKPDTATKVQEPGFPQVPRRKLGKTGVEVSCLALGGGARNFVDNQIIFRTALRYGVTYWDTAKKYSGGNSERAIGKFLSNNPEVRKKLFIVTKASDAKTIADVEKCLQTSLKRMNTKYIDLFYGVHMLSDPARLTDGLRQWAENAKRRKLIRFFGFSTHDNITQCLGAAARLDWIDAILARYNFRSMQDAKMQAAVEACHKAGIGLTAMKTQAKEITTQEDRKLTSHFLERGFTEGQAKIKVVLEDKRFSSACVGMKSVAVLTSNVAAVLDKTKLTQADMDVFAEYAKATCSDYCAGCAYICNSAVPDVPCISDIMRYLMYCNSYGEKDRARELFAKTPAKIRNKLLSADYSLAEARCPQRIPIGKLVAEAASKLA